ncbi:MAG TPA: hypothetical protein VJ741_15150 [Solirubrobacteraceae bacterium]|nr:hypothetical protein [Solirubrobacteraceae bacterium]
MARIVAFIPDLLFGSNVLGALNAAGYETTLVSDGDALQRELAGAAALIVDLTADAAARIEQVSAIPRNGVKTLAFYSHVEQDVRDRAERAGFDLVIPRSRMAREGGAVLARLLET